IEVTESEPSLIASSIVCEWQSTMPGVTYLPVASITRAFALARKFDPTAAILPLRTRMSAFTSVPCDAVRIVALRINISPLAAASVRRCITPWLNTTSSDRVSVRKADAPLPTGGGGAAGVGEAVGDGAGVATGAAG